MPVTETTQAVLDAAKDLISKGRRVFPLSGQKLPYALCHACKPHGSDPKHRESCPCLKDRVSRCHGLYAATDDIGVVQHWLEETPDMGLAVATGEPSGMFVMEYDPKNGGDESYADWVSEFGAIHTETNLSPGGGYHFIFQLPGFDVRNIHGKLAPGIDIKGTGGYHVVPPTRTDKGVYVSVVEGPAAPCPDWLRDKIFLQQSRNKWADTPGLLRPVERKEFNAEYLTDEEIERTERTINYWCNRIKLAPDGNQNILIYTSARVLFSLCFAGLLDEDHAETVLLEACEEGNHPEHRAILAIDSGRRMAMSNPDPVEAILSNDLETLVTFQPDDLGNANRVLYWNGLDLRYDPDRERFHTWSTNKWVIARDGRIRNLVEDVISKIILTEADFYSNESMPPNEVDKKRPKTYRELFIHWAGSQRYSRKISDCITTLRGRENIWCKTDDFDRDPYHLNVINGVLDLRTGELLPHDRSFLCSQIANVKYNPDAKAPEWERFLELTQPDLEHRKYLQRLIGYTILGEVRDQIFAVHLGSGGNGKGVFLDTIAQIIGEYATTGQRDSFIRKNNSNRIPADIASMEGKRMVLVDELNDNQKMDEALLKDVTGGGTIKAEAKNVNPWEYTPRFTLHFRTNHLPDLPPDKSILRRFSPVKWTVEPTGADWDSFSSSLYSTPTNYLVSTEAEGILNWILEGTQDYLEGKLRVPDDLKRETHSLLQENDPFLIFMSENIATSKGNLLDGSKLHKEYAKWFKDNEFNGKPISSRTLYREIKQGRYKGFEWTTHRDRFHLVDVQLANIMMR